MAQALINKGSGHTDSGEDAPGVVSQTGCHQVRPLAESRSRGWSDRRQKFRSEVHNSDRKIAAALYVALTLVLFSIVGV
jgi:hypothetical protein